MSVRRLFAGLATTAVAAASLSLVAPAQADPAAGYAPASSDLIGVGSDTSEHALTYLANGHDGVAGYNATNPANKLVSWNATAPAGAAATINLPGNPAAIRPNGSGAGMSTLFGSGNVPEIDFARSSSALNAAQTSAGLQAFPFAKDSLAMASAKTTNAPAALTVEQVVKIYDGKVTNWSELGGTAGPIKAYVPQAGSGTRSFFLGQLKAANGGVDVSLAGVAETQEHDPSAIQNDPAAIAPFSVGRNNVIGAPLTIKGGFAAARALYNVVRQGDVAKPEITAVFGGAGFVCSAEAKPLIEAAGFDQLATTAGGGVCGVPTQAATSNLTTSTVQATTTTLVGESKAAGALTLTATVAATGSPAGSVRFYLDGATTPSGAPVPLTGGRAVANLANIKAGAHSVVAKFTPTLTSYKASESAPVSVTVLAADAPKPPVVTPDAKPVASKVVLKFKKSYTGTKAVTGTVTVKGAASAKATGKVVIKLGKKKAAVAKLTNGKAKVTLKGLKKGKNKLVAAYAGDKAYAKSSAKLTITVR